MTPNVIGPFPLAMRPTIFAAVISALRVGQMAGDFPTGRTDPTGDELVIWIGQPDAVIGFATFYEAKPGTMWLDLIWVAPEHRRKGLSKALLMRVLDISRRGKISSIQFGTMLDNAAMQAAGKLVAFKPHCLIMERAL